MVPDERLLGPDRRDSASRLRGGGRVDIDRRGVWRTAAIKLGTELDGQREGSCDPVEHDDIEAAGGGKPK